MAVFIAPPGSATSGSGEGWGLLDDACLARKFEPVQRLVNFVAGRGEKARPRAALGAGRFGRARVAARGWCGERSHGDLAWHRANLDLDGKASSADACGGEEAGVNIEHRVS